jgi:hypothetical protein
MAGAAQLGLAIASLTLPAVLGFRSETARLRPLLRQIFWVYAAYILGAHVAFGLLSLLAAPALVGRTTLAAAVCAFIATWWLARLGVQFFYFDRHGFPDGPLYRAGEVALVGLFVFLASVYGAALVANLG